VDNGAKASSSAWAVVIMHHHPCCSNQWCCTGKQGTAKDAKAPLSVPPPPSSSRTLVETAAIFAIMEEGKEWAMMPPRDPPLLSCHHRHAPSSALPSLMPLHEQARNGQ
jgi:hypothetical protein